MFAENLLFATLDPTMREIKLPGFDKVILSDTVGFVSDLPTELIAAFRATLEEVASADLLVHVRDMAHPDREAQREDVDDVLSRSGWRKRARRTNRSVEQGRLARPKSAIGLLEAAKRRNDVVPISALTGEGVDASAGADGATNCTAASRFTRSGCRRERGADRLAALPRRSARASGSIRRAGARRVRLSADNWARFQALESA